MTTLNALLQRLLGSASQVQSALEHTGLDAPPAVYADLGHDAGDVFELSAEVFHPAG